MSVVLSISSFRNIYQILNTDTVLYCHFNSLMVYFDLHVRDFERFQFYEYYATPIMVILKHLKIKLLTITYNKILQIYHLQNKIKRNALK
jgi:hypothetical protein